MAKLYMNAQLIACSDVPGVLGPTMADGDIVMTYPCQKDCYYSVIIYDDNDIHSLLINVVGDDLETGDALVDYKPFTIHLFNYDVIVYVYKQQGKLPLPDDDFDMDEFVLQNTLILLYKMEVLVLQKLNLKPNVLSTRYLNQKLKALKI